MTTVISGDASADFATPLPVAEGGTGASTSVGSGSVMLSAQTGSAPVFGARAWGNFSGSTGATNASGNLSCTRTATGVYTLTMTTAMPDANYAVAVLAGGGNLGNNWNWLETLTVTRSTTQFSIGFATNATAFDPTQFSVIVFR